MSLLFTPPTPPAPDHPTIIAGRIQDATTQEPLENANAFLSGTTIGTSSDARGGFVLRTDRAGSLDLVVSIVGFDRTVIHLQLAASESTFVTVSLLPHILESEQVQVMATGTEEWRENLARFEKVFRGEGEFADDCRLLNPYVVDLRMNDNTLIARSDSFLRMENSALGYAMGVVIKTFNWDIPTNMGIWSAYVHFRELPPVSGEQRREWAENRRRVYEGSMRHFLSALAHKRLFEQGFTMKSAWWVGSLAWNPIVEDSIHLTGDPATSLLRWNYRKWVRVEPDAPSLYPCFIHLVEDHASFDSSGVLATPLAFDLAGTWARERMGSALPVDYVPDHHP